MKKLYGIRTNEETTAVIENFAEVHSMKPTTAAEYLVKYGVQSLMKNEHMDARLDRLEGQLKAMQLANYRLLSYVSLLPAGDKDKFENAKQAAEKNVAEIFGDSHGE